MKIIIPQKKFMPFIWLYYPFKKEEIIELNEDVNWKLLSNNESVKWDYHLIKEYESFWDWDALKDNKGVFKRVSLHLLFTDRVEPIKCNCEMQLDNCDCVTEYDIWGLYYRSRADKYFNVGYEKYGADINRFKIVTQNFIGFERLKMILKMESSGDVSFIFD
ncbi:hypothetical protein [Lutibacter sp.]|uniref:hypothetical protein n=1 Tax=Lutibacter sp. TaxID=1925666 RepID=UPI001A2E9C47|nr:hypothetical protein [Lutibacter sp.]MBI9040264.1 hypothetical protein [Lutibacter sp.]